MLVNRETLYIIIIIIKEGKDVMDLAVESEYHELVHWLEWMTNASSNNVITLLSSLVGSFPNIFSSPLIFSLYPHLLSFLFFFSFLLSLLISGCYKAYNIQISVFCTWPIH